MEAFLEFLGSGLAKALFRVVMALIGAVIEIIRQQPAATPVPA